MQNDSKCGSKIISGRKEWLKRRRGFNLAGKFWHQKFCSSSPSFVPRPLFPSRWGFLTSPASSWDSALPLWRKQSLAGGVPHVDTTLVLGGFLAVINRGMIRPMLRHYYPAEASAEALAEAESVEILSILHLPRLRQYAEASAN